MLNNTKRYYCYKSMYHIAFLFSSGAIIQSYLKYTGFSPMRVSVFTACISAGQLLSMLLSVFVSDRVKNIPKAIAYSVLPMAAFFFALTGIGFVKDANTERVFYFAAGICFATNFLIGFKNVFDYKLPYIIINPGEYAYIETRAGIILNVSGFAVSAAYSLLLNRFDYSVVIISCFIISTGLVVLSVFSIGGIKIINKNTVFGGQAKFTLAVFREKSMKFLAAANFIRGVANGILAMAAIVMLSTVTGDARVAPFLAPVTTAAGIAGCGVYSRVYKKISPTKLCLIGGMVMCVAMLLSFTGGATVFFMMYFIAFFGETIVDYAIPVYITQIVGYQIAGGYSAIRMLLTTAGVAAGNSIAGFFAEGAHPGAAFYIGGVLQLIAVFFYFIYGLSDTYNRAGPESE